MKSLFAMIALLLACPLECSRSVADQLTLEIDGKKIELVGEILIEAQDNSLYFRGNDGKIWFVQPSQIVHRIDDRDEVKPISKKDLRNQLSQQLPSDFKFHETRHYLIAYQTESTFARWIGNLFEQRLYRGFEQYWKKKKFPLERPFYPMVILIFATEQNYQAFIEAEFGAGQTMVAHYNLQTNQVAMYDLTSHFRPRNQELSDRKLTEILQNSAVLPMITTVIHEGTHQLIFNRGLQVRFAENPLWLNEGLAVFFETATPDSKSGWREPGMISQYRLGEFRQRLAARPADSLQALIRNDERFLGEDHEKVLGAYAEAWVLTHFLLNKHPESYVSYLKHLATKRPLIADSPEVRLAEFEVYFGADWHKLDRDLLEYVQTFK